MNFTENFGQILAMAGFVPSAEFYKPDDAGNLLRELIIGNYSVSTLPGDLTSFDFDFADESSGQFGFRSTATLQPTNSFRLKADQLAEFEWTVDGNELSLFDLDFARSRGFIFNDDKGQNLLSWDLFTKSSPNGGGVYRLFTSETDDIFDQTATVAGPTGEISGSFSFGYSLSVDISFGQQLGSLTMEAFQDGALIDSKPGQQNGIAPSIAPFTLFAVDSSDACNKANFVDRTWLIDTGAGLDTVWIGGAATLILESGAGFDTIKNFQLGSTKLQVNSVSNLSFADSTEGVQIAQGNDLIAVVSWQSASTFSSNASAIFVA